MPPNELSGTLQMCGKSSTGGISDLLDYLEECAMKVSIEQFNIVIIRKWVMSCIYYDDADVPLTAPVLKIILKRAWAGKHGNITRPSLVHATEELSPFSDIRHE